MTLIEVGRKIEGDSGPISKCEPEPPPKPEIRLVAIKKRRRGEEINAVGIVVGERQRLFLPNLTQVKITAGRGKGGGVIEVPDKRLQNLLSQEPPEPEPPPEDKNLRVHRHYFD